MSTQEKTYKILNKEELENSELELEVEVPYQTLENHRSEAIKSLSKDLEVSGFRKGSVPENIAVQKLGEMNILEHSAYKTLNTLIPLIITSEKINALTEPQINITKIAPKSDLVFKMKVVLLPKVELADYKKIASDTKKIDDTPVTEKEMDEYIEYLRNQRAKALKTSDDKEEKVPEFDDEFVKSLGDFKNVEDFKTQLKENMSNEKKNKEVQKRRLEIIEKIIEESKIEVPTILVDQELDRMLGQFRHDIERVGMKFDDYLKEIKKTKDDLQKEWKTDATKRAKMNLILPKIAVEEKIKIDDEVVEKEVEELLKQHKDIDKSHARLYVKNVLMNEEVFKFLESK